jgi:DNA-binding CsgD family transcriptional regulator
MDLESIYDSWGDILEAVQSKDKDPELFQRLFIGSITEDTLSSSQAPHHPEKSFRRHSPKSMRTSVCFFNESMPPIYFTPREAECVAYVIQGYTHPQAAQELKLSKRTVEFYIKNVRRKLNCRNKEELIKIVNSSDFSRIVDKMVKKGAATMSTPRV